MGRPVQGCGHVEPQEEMFQRSSGTRSLNDAGSREMGSRGHGDREYAVLSNSGMKGSCGLERVAAMSVC